MPTPSNGYRDARVFHRDGEEAVGAARLMYPESGGSGDELLTNLHGYSLQDYQKSGDTMVMIMGVTIRKQLMDLIYPYRYRGCEKNPKRLNGIEHGFHTWDLNAMHPFDHSIAENLNGKDTPELSAQIDKSILTDPMVTSRTISEEP